LPFADGREERKRGGERRRRLEFRKKKEKI
jgi:hypothetical protein